MRKLTALSLLDAHEAAGEIEQITSGKTFDDYLQDRVMRLAVERLFEIVGEAIGRAEKSEADVVNLIADARAVTGMRNRISHGYDQIANETVWRAAMNEIPALRNEIERQVSLAGYWPG